MGNCLPTARKEKKKESVRRRRSSSNSAETHEVLSRASEFKQSRANEPADMTRALSKAKENDIKSSVSVKKARKTSKNMSASKPNDDTLTGSTIEIAEVNDEERKKIESMDSLEALMDEILEEEETKLESSIVSKHAVAFDVAIVEDNQSRKPKMPTRLAERLTAPKEKKSELDYTDEEEQLMAEILRDDQLNERKEKARREEVKIYDAKRKRLCLEKSKECMRKQKQNSDIPDPAEQRKKVKEMAEENRRKAAEKKGVVRGHL